MSQLKINMKQIIINFVLLLLNFEIKANFEIFFELAEKCLPDENFSKINLVADPYVNDEILQQFSEIFLLQQLKYTGSKLW